MSVKGGDVVFNFKANDKELKKDVDNMGTSIKKMVTALGLDKLIGKTMSALNNSLDGAIKRVDTLNNFPRVMKNLGIKTEDATEAVNQLSDGLIGLPTTLNDAVSAVQRFTSQNNDVKKSTKIFLALNNAILAGGASTEVQASAMEQLSQAYAKGKPDAMEWRSMLTAMPAQLKQVAKAMGYNSTAVGGDLYKAIQKGKVSMDDFMNTIIKLDKKGTKGFSSFAKQAKDATGGIGTSITNVKTSITRGLANSIEAINKALKKANLPNINEIIQKSGNVISDVFKKVNSYIGKINLKRIIPIIKEVVEYINNLKNAALGFLKEVLKHIPWDTVLEIAPTILKVVASIKLLNPLISITKSGINSLGKAVDFFSSKTNVIIAVIGALTTAFAYLAQKQSQEQQEILKLGNKVGNAKEEWDEYTKSIENNASKELANINNSKKLRDELKNLVDENGKVKKGYEARVKFILNQLNSALGTEYKLNGNIIKGYKELQKEIDKLIKKKTAEIKLKLSEEKYKKAVEMEQQATENLNETLKKLGISYSDAKKKVEELKTKINEGKISISNLSDENIQLIASFEEADKQVKRSTEDQKKYIKDYEYFTKGEYDKIGTTVKTTTKNWTDTSEQEIKDNIKEQETNLKRLEDLYKNTGNNIYKQQIDSTKKELTELRTKLKERTSTVKYLSTAEIQKYLELAQNDRKAFNNEMSKSKGDTKKQLQAIATVIDQNKNIPKDKMGKVAQLLKSQITNLDSKKWGKDLIQGMATGITQKAKTALSSASAGAAGIIAKWLHFSRPDIGPLRYYEKWMPDFVNGLSKSLEASTPSLYKVMGKMANQMQEQLSTGFKMSPTLNNVSSYNPSVNVTIHNNMETDFMGNLVSNIKTFSNGSKNDYNYGMS